jgi:hypothetical protein
MPPNLAAASHGDAHGHGMRSPAEQFWIIKHGLKMTGMPAWGRTHDDESLWAIVAFLRQLPNLNVDQYRALTGGADDSPALATDHRDQRHGDEAQAHRVLSTIEREDSNAVAPAGQRAATDATTVSGQVHNH